MYKLVSILSLIFFSLSSCKPGDADHELCPNGTSEVRHTLNGKGFVIPNAFTPNGDGLNDIFGVIANQKTKFLFIQITDGSGNIIHTDTNLVNQNTSWAGKNKNDNTPYPAGKYNVYYKVVLDDGTAGAAAYEGNSCLSLLRSSPDKKCVVALEDWHNYVLIDMFDPIDLSTPYNSGEIFCP
jgi:gliding motility-associated-like protein